MSREQELAQWLERVRSRTWYGDQDENGVDLSLIRENLKLTPEQRLLKGDQGRRSAQELLEYGRRWRKQERSEPDR
jgi:hypothetical protein